MVVTESVWNGCVAATPDPASVAVHFTVTSLLFQPLLLGAGVKLAATTGPVLSSVYDAWVELDAPVHLPLSLKSGEALTVNACAPSPAGAVVANVQFDLAEDDVCVGRVVAPLTVTHFVSLLVTTVRFSAAPRLAYSVPPTLTVPVVPLNTALVAVDAEAVGALIVPTTVTTAARNATLRNDVEARVGPRFLLLDPITLTRPPGTDRDPP